MELDFDMFLMGVLGGSVGLLGLTLVALRGLVRGLIPSMMDTMKGTEAINMSSKDPTEDEVLEWESAKCKDCGFSFPKSEAWASRCIGCFKKSKGYNRVIADNSFLWAQHEMRRLEQRLKEAQQELAAVRGAGSRPGPAPSPAPSADSLPDDLLQDIVRLCHPDLHGNSERATKTTQALLTLRAARRAAKGK